MYCVCSDPQYVGFELQLRGGCGVHEAQQRAHVIVSGGRENQLLDDHQRMLATLPVFHYVVHATGTAKLPEQTCNRNHHE